ncbi:MAG: hypothetical protein SVM79_07210 [Chloroflexota bacterium]|nr:hypothetical protein [Chloroflexota bacterium]
MVLADQVLSPLELWIPRNHQEMELYFLVQTHIQIEKLRIASNKQCASLAAQGFDGPLINKVQDSIEDFERWIELEIEKLVMSHPAWTWLSEVKGAGPENYGKVIAFIGDIGRFSTVSRLWGYAGYGVVGGKALRKTKGQRMSWNENLRTMCWRLGTSLMRARGSYYRYYAEIKATYEQQYEGRIVKARKGVSVPPDMITTQHIHNMALRRMIKLFLSHLWEKWREAKGLPVGEPYAIDRLGHATPIKPFID